jgi:hypothetical protein
MMSIQTLHLTGAAILVSRGMKVLQVAPAGELSRSPALTWGIDGVPLTDSLDRRNIWPMGLRVPWQSRMDQRFRIDRNSFRRSAHVGDLRRLLFHVAVLRADGSVQRGKLVGDDLVVVLGSLVGEVFLLRGGPGGVLLHLGNRIIHHAPFALDAWRRDMWVTGERLRLPIAKDGIPYRVEGCRTTALHLTRPALRFFETSRSLQPARQVNGVVRYHVASEVSEVVQVSIR